MTIDIEAARRDTLGVEERIHLNNAGCSLPPRSVTDTVIRYLSEEARHGGYELKAQRAEEISQVYETIANFIGAASGEEIALCENATRAWDMVFYGQEFTEGDVILTCAAEYGSNAIAYLHHGGRQGAEVRVVPNDPSGQVDLDLLAKELENPRVKLVSMNHVPTQGGLVNPAAEVGKLANESGTLYLLDACQSVGQMPIDVDTIGCDVLTATGRKYLRGPRGTGFLYVRQSAIEKCPPAFLENGSAVWDTPWTYALREGATRYESWEKNYALLLGLGEAVRYASDLGVQAIWARIQHLAGYLRDSLAAIEGVTVEDQGEQKCGIVTFSTRTGQHADLQGCLSRAGVNVSVSRQTSSQWDLPARDLGSVIRASIHYFNTVEEVDQFVDLLAEHVQEQSPCA